MYTTIYEAMDILLKANLDNEKHNIIEKKSGITFEGTLFELLPMMIGYDYLTEGYMEPVPANNEDIICSAFLDVWIESTDTITTLDPSATCRTIMRELFPNVYKN